MKRVQDSNILPGLLVAVLGALGALVALGVASQCSFTVAVAQVRMYIFCVYASAFFLRRFLVNVSVGSHSKLSSCLDDITYTHNIFVS